jgi:hypothetical protein
VSGERDRPFDLRPLAHPLWWLALVVLYVNDNLLKGRGIVPGWLTGKLSDFAFLIVAPVLLGCLLPVRLRRRKEVALALVAGLYVATELSATAAGAVVAAAAWLGMRWRLWPDLTDLMALVVLPLAWRLLDRPWPGARPLRPLGVIVGLHLCLATTDDSWQTHPFLVNRSSDEVTMRLTAVRMDLCRADHAAFAAFAAQINVGDLGAVDEFTLERGDVAALDQPPALGRTAARTCYDEPFMSGEPCSAMLVEVVGGPAVLFRTSTFWSPSRSSHCRSPRIDPGSNPGPAALSLLGEPGALSFQASSADEMELVPVSRADIEARGVPPQSCGGIEQQFGALLDHAGTCAGDADCQPVRLPPQIPPQNKPCFIYTDAASVALINDLAVRADRCTWAMTPIPRCPDLPPGVCRAGRCEAACPGCAHWCHYSEELLRGCALEGDLCVLTDTRWCRCDGKLWHCGEPASLTSCAVKCANIGLPPWLPDASTDSSAGAADGGVDAAADSASGVDAPADTASDSD